MMTQQEFEQIYSTIWARLTTMARRFGRAAGIEVDADDVAQEALIALWQLAEQGYPVRNAEGLLVRITKTICIARLRKHKGNVSPIDEVNVEGGYSATSSVEQTDAALIKDRLYACLTKTEREYMQLKTDGGLSVAEMSEMTGVAKPLISTALSKAR